MARITKSFTIEKELCNFLEKKAKELGISKSDFINMILKKQMNQDRQEGGNEHK